MSCAGGMPPRSACAFVGELLDDSAGTRAFRIDIDRQDDTSAIRRHDKTESAA